MTLRIRTCSGCGVVQVYDPQVGVVTHRIACSHCAGRVWQDDVQVEPRTRERIMFGETPATAADAGESEPPAA